MALVMTASRGGIRRACCWAARSAPILYRHLVSYSRIAGWVLGPLVLLVRRAELSRSTAAC